MALGISLSISLPALLAHYSRQLAMHLSLSRAPAAWNAVALAGGLMLVFVGLLLCVSAQPEFGGSIRPFSR